MAGVGTRSEASGNKRADIDSSAIIPFQGSYLINSSLIQHDPLCIDYLRRIGSKPEFWHRFTITIDPSCKEKYSKLFLLNLLTDFVYPHDLLPLYVTEKENQLYFLARNCLDAVIKLCEARLLLPNPVEPFLPFSIVIVKNILKTSQIPVINVEPNLLEVLKKREHKGLLDLTEFQEDEGLQEFCPLSQPKVLLYVLSLTSKLETDDLKMTKVVLCGNHIKKLPNLSPLQDRFFTAIDLAHNKIESVNDLEPLKDLPDLLWLRLEGNPLCQSFDRGTTYFQHVKTICKNLQTLDTKRLCEDGWYKKHKTFLCDPTGFDFCNQFLEQYYSYFDEPHRPCIQWFYHPNAMFSLTHYSTKSYSKMHNQMNTFIYEERNLLGAGGAVPEKFLYIGRPAIQNQLQRVLPSLLHHRHAFKVDLMLYTRTMAQLTVTGVFKDCPVEFTQEELLGGFSRTFVFTCNEKGEWLITNDQWHIQTPFKHKALLPPWPEQKPLCSFPRLRSCNKEELNALTQTLHQLTGLTYKQSETLLFKHDWNLATALKVFLDKYVNNELPDEVFSPVRNMPRPDSPNSEPTSFDKKTLDFRFLSRLDLAEYLLNNQDSSHWPKELKEVMRQYRPPNCPPYQSFSLKMVTASGPFFHVTVPAED